MGQAPEHGRRDDAKRDAQAAPGDEPSSSGRVPSPSRTHKPKIVVMGKRALRNPRTKAGGSENLHGVQASKRAKVKPLIKRGKRASVTVDEGSNEGAQTKSGMRFIGFLALVYGVFLIVTGQVASFVNAFAGADWHWIFGGIMMFVLYFVFGVLAYVVAVILDPTSPVGIRDLMSVEASGIFFGNLTPLMMGAVPAQIFRLTRTGLDVGEATATQLSRFIIFQFGEVILGGLLLLARFEYFLTAYGDIVLLNLVIFLAHAVQCLGLLVVCLCPRFVMRVGNGTLRFAIRRGWIKNREKWDNLVNVQVLEFSAAFRRSAKHFTNMSLTLVVTLLQLACLYAIPWFVLGAFGHRADFITCLAAGGMVQLVATAVPLPGGTVGAEGGFTLFYGPMFGGEVMTGCVVWRILTFFLPTFMMLPMLQLQSSRVESLHCQWRRFRSKTRRRRTAAFTIDSGQRKQSSKPRQKEQYKN